MSEHKEFQRREILRCVKGSSAAVLEFTQVLGFLKPPSKEPNLDFSF